MKKKSMNELMTEMQNIKDKDEVTSEDLIRGVEILGEARELNRELERKTAIIKIAMGSIFTGIAGFIIGYTKRNY